MRIKHRIAAIEAVAGGGRGTKFGSKNFIFRVAVAQKLSTIFLRVHEFQEQV